MTSFETSAKETFFRCDFAVVAAAGGVVGAAAVGAAEVGAAEVGAAEVGAAEVGAAALGAADDLHRYTCERRAERS